MNKQNLIINISNLNKKYLSKNNQYVEIIRNLNFKIESNSKISIIGPSGSGKTTLLNIIGLLDSDFEGSYSFNGKDVSLYSEKEKNNIRGLSIGFVHQFFHLIPELTVIENVMLPILINKKDNDSYNQSKSILTQFGLQDRLNYKPIKLSGGEQQRVAIARSFINNPDLILADEMTGNLDEETANKIFNFFINYINQHKKTLIYVTHNKKLSLFADKIYSFNNKGLVLKND